MSIAHSENTHGEGLLLVKLKALACNFTKSNTLPWLFFMFLKLHKWYQLAQRISYVFNEVDFTELLGKKCNTALVYMELYCFVKSGFISKIMM